MQLYALDNGFPISAGLSIRGKNYICPECLSPVRVRGGPSRQIHFYHLSLTKDCRQHQKSQEHLQLQLKLLEVIGPKNVQMECPFSSVQRIADVAWHEKKLIFEIQCSSISLEEAQNRITDYTSIGYQVIWILHKNQFNRKVLSAAENYLRSTPCYFTDIDKTGKGMIYDQFEVIKDHRRLFKGPPLSISILKSTNLSLTMPSSESLPKIVLNRLIDWKLYMQGDLLHRLLEEGHLAQAAKEMRTLENSLLQEIKNPSKKMSLGALIRHSYRALLNNLLKKLTSEKL